VCPIPLGRDLNSSLKSNWKDLSKAPPGFFVIMFGVLFIVFTGYMRQTVLAVLNIKEKKCILRKQCHNVRNVGGFIK
jgi:hypothetical protein